jgi:1-acyl-sn-glycerol-3-phosphate acyltransferase
MAGWLTIVLVFPRLSPDQRDARVQVWARQMLAVLGIDLQLHGHAARAGRCCWWPTIFRGWTSWSCTRRGIAALCPSQSCKRWPLIGTLATGAARCTSSANRAATPCAWCTRWPSLKAGEILAVFPEGTTSDGVSLLPFHANLIQAAISAGAPVQPVALSFMDRRHRADQPGAVLHRRRHADRLDLAHADHAGDCGRGAVRAAAAGTGA